MTHSNGQILSSTIDPSYCQVFICYVWLLVMKYLCGSNDNDYDQPATTLYPPLCLPDTMLFSLDWTCLLMVGLCWRNLTQVKYVKIIWRCLFRHQVLPWQRTVYTLNHLSFNYCFSQPKKYFCARKSFQSTTTPTLKMLGYCYEDNNLFLSL